MRRAFVVEIRFSMWYNITQTFSMVRYYYEKNDSLIDYTFPYAERLLLSCFKNDGAAG